MIDSFFIRLDFGHLPDLTTMSGLLDLLTLCNLGIFFNVLDRRTYGEEDPSYLDTLRLDKYDYNAISEEDRRKYVYARGLSLELIQWLNTRMIITGVEGNSNPQERLEIEDLHVQIITRQGLTIFQYLEKWIAEEKKKEDPHFPIVDKDSLEKQMAWAMATIPWIETSWRETLEENAESFYLGSLYPASGQPLLQEETEEYSRWSETQIYSLLLKFIIDRSTQVEERFIERVCQRETKSFLTAQSHAIVSLFDPRILRGSMIPQQWGLRVRNGNLILQQTYPNQSVTMPLSKCQS